jgi:hypothetical protein
MDGNQFDGLLRTATVARSRRIAAFSVLGGMIGLLGLGETAAGRHKKHKKKKRGSPPVSPPPTTSPPAGCQRNGEGRTCGDDGCSGSCGSCLGDKTCQGGACVCPSGEIECDTNICVPPDAQCCTDGQCPGRVCVRGQCVTWQDTCPAGSDSCASTPNACGRTLQCGCYQSTEGDTRCGTAPDSLGQCEVCHTSADCVALYPEIPGVFCRTSGTNCCPGTCRKPCPE